MLFLQINDFLIVHFNIENKKMKNLEKMKIFEKTIKMDNESNEMIDLKPISEKEFREVTKGCGIKYRNKIPSKELKAMLG